MLGQAGIPHELRPLTLLTLCYSPLPELWDRPVHNDLQEIAAAGAAAEAEATEILHQKQAEAAKEAEKAAARVLSRKTQAGCSTQPTKEVVAAAGAGTAAAATKFGSTSLAEAGRGSMGGRRALKSGAAVAGAGGRQLTAVRSGGGGVEAYQMCQ